MSLRPVGRLVSEYLPEPSAGKGVHDTRRGLRGHFLLSTVLRG